MNSHDEIKRAELRRKAIPVLLLVLLIVLSLVIYVPAYDAPMLFDGRTHIEDNENVKQLSPATWFHGSRWLVMMTFAMNYEFTKGELWSFHLTNTIIHVFSALLLFGVIHRTLGMLDRFTLLKENRISIGLFSSLIWFSHPLQTQSVIYSVQRMESMMGMFLLACLYCFVRSFESKRRFAWMSASVVCCYLSAFCKEVAVCIPLVVVAFDWVFGDDFEKLVSTRRWFLRGVGKRWLYYVGLFGVLLVFASPLTRIANAALASSETQESVMGNSNGQSTPTAESPRNSSDNFSSAIRIKGLSSLSYATNQPAVILSYLRKSFLPTNLCFDPAWPIRTAGEQMGSIVSILLILSFGILLLVRRSPLGFCIIAFFVVLAPTSSFLPILDLCYEHRMYIPLALVVTPAVCGITILAGKFGRLAIGNIVLVVFLISATLLANDRCQVYRSRLDIWADVIKKSPHNPRAYLNHGEVRYFEKQDFLGAIDDYNRCLEQMTNPVLNVPPVVEIEVVYRNLSSVHNNFGLLQLRNRKLDSARYHFEKAIENDPTNASAHSSMGNFHFTRNEWDQAREWYQKALQLNPDLEVARKNLQQIFNLHNRN